MRPLGLVIVIGLAVAGGCSPGRDSGDDGGGNGGGNNNPPPGKTPAPLIVVSTDPDDGEIDVDLGDSIVILFNQIIDAATVNADTITFTSNVGPIDGVFTVQGAAVTFDPADDLPSASPIVGTVTTDVGAVGGAQLAQDYPFAFETASAAVLVAEGYNLDQARVAVSAGGLVMVMWVQYLADDRIFARAWEPATGWVFPIEVAESETTISNLQVLCTESNEAVAVWVEGASSPYSIVTARFTAGLGWSAPESLTTQSTSASPAFAMDREGWGAVKFPRVGGGTYIRFLDADGAWEAEQILAMPAAPSLACGSDGAFNGTQYNSNPATGSGSVLVYRIEADGGMTYQTLFGGFAYYTGTTRRPDGDVACIGLSGDVFAWQYDGSDWNAISTADGPAGTTWNLDLASAPGGETFVAWVVQPGAQGTRNLMGAVLDPTLAWVDVQSLETFDAWSGDPIVACPDTGEGWVIFSQFDGTAESIWFARYVPGSGWEMTIELDETADPCSEPQVSAQGAGGCAVWFRQPDGMPQLMARILD